MWRRNWAWLLIALCALGCGDSGPPSGTTDGSGVKSYKLSQLTRTTQELPPLDQNRVEIPTPEGWHWGSQERQILARFHLKDRSGLPQIIVKLDSEFTPTIADVTRDNVVEYAEQLQAFLDSKEARLLEPVKPLVLGDLAWARYVQAGKLPNKKAATVDRQILKTTHGGRTYVLELQVPVDGILQYRDDAYGVAATIKFLAPEEKPSSATNPPDAPAPGDTPPPGDAPAETPAEKPPEKPAEKPADQPAAKPTDAADGQPANSAAAASPKPGES